MDVVIVENVTNQSIKSLNLAYYITDKLGTDFALNWNPDKSEVYAVIVCERNDWKKL